MELEQIAVEINLTMDLGREPSRPERPSASERTTRRRLSAEEKIPRRAGGFAQRGKHRRTTPPRGRRYVATSMYYGWPKEFLEAGRKRLAGETARAATSNLRREAQALKEVVADLTLENRLLKKRHDCGLGRGGMRYPASEKSRDHPAGRGATSAGATDLEKLRIPRATFYRWCDQPQDGRAGGGG